MKKIVLTVMLSAFAVAGFSQYAHNAPGTYDRVTERGPYMTNRFFDNWFIMVGGGVNYYIGGNFNEGDFGDRLAPALDVSLGKWITPSVGVRLQYAGLSAKTFTNIGSTQSGEGPFKKEFDVMNLHADFLWNISNAIGGYKETRTWDVIPFVGAGIAQSNNGTTDYMADKAVWRPSLNVGLINNFRLGGVVDLNLEARVMFVDKDFDQYVSSATNQLGYRTDEMYSLTAGLSFKLGPKGGFKRPLQPEVADYTPYNQRISSLEGELADANARAARLASELQAEKNKPATTKEVVIGNATTTVFFTIGSAVISERDMLNLERMAAVIKEAPDSKFGVTGYADSSTGSAQRNQVLSQQRADAVAKALTEKFGVKASQLVISAKGGVSDHKNPALDRAVIVKLD